MEQERKKKLSNEFILPELWTNKEYARGYWLGQAENDIYLVKRGVRDIAYIACSKNNTEEIENLIKRWMKKGNSLCKEYAMNYVKFSTDLGKFIIYRKGFRNKALKLKRLIKSRSINVFAIGLLLGYKKEICNNKSNGLFKFERKK